MLSYSSEIVNRIQKAYHDFPFWFAGENNTDGKAPSGVPAKNLYP